MSEEKMTAQEWHELGAKALAKENEKIVDKLMKALQEENDRMFSNNLENLRDKFAGLTMQAIISNPNFDHKHSPAIFEMAYEIADGMIKEKEKRNNL